MKIPPVPSCFAREYKLVPLSAQPVPEQMMLCDTPDKAAGYWTEAVNPHPYFNREVETFVVLHLNTRRRVRAFQIVSMGTADTLLSVRQS